MSEGKKKWKMEGDCKLEEICWSFGQRVNKREVDRSKMDLNHLVPMAMVCVDEISM